MTDIDLNEESFEEKKESGYAKLRASLKEKYEGQINSLQEKIQQLESGNSAMKKDFFTRSLKFEGFEGDFDEFAEKYSNLGIEEMVALYKGMNGASIKSSEGNDTDVKTDTQSDLGSKSVLGNNPTSNIGSTEDPSKMDGKAYLNYLKQNMTKLGLE